MPETCEPKSVFKSYDAIWRQQLMGVYYYRRVRVISEPRPSGCVRSLSLSISGESYESHLVPLDELVGTE